MPRTIADEIYSALCTLSAIEHQILQLRDQLTALLASAHVPDTRQETSSPPQATVTCVAEKTAVGTLAQDATGIDLEQWLIDRGIRIRQKRADIAFDPTFDRLAKQLGDNYDSLFILYAAIKRRFGALFPRGISLQGLAPQQIGLVVNFGNELLRNSFLKEFRYDRKLKTVSFEPQENGQVQNFFTGGWFERYVFLRAKEYLARSHNASEITALLNPKITLPDGQDFELDMLIGTTSVVLWLECKTGRDYPAYAARYQEIATKHMRMSPIHSALVLLEPLTDEQKRNSSSVAGMSVLNLPDLGHFFDNAVSGQEQEGIMQLASLSAPANAITTLEEYTAVLNHAKLRPLSPIERRRIISDLCEQALNLGRATPLQEIAQVLKEHYDTAGVAISKSQILDVCRALRISGMCQRGSHPKYDHDVWLLRTEIPVDAMANACACLYVWVLLKAPGLQITHPQRVQTVVTILFGDDLDETEAAQHLTGLIEQLIASGNCVYDNADGVPTPRAVGEEYEVKI